MIPDAMIENVEALSADMVVADPNDLQDLGKIHKYFEILSDKALKAELHRLVCAASAAADLVQKIMLDEIPDREGVFKVLSQTVTAIQQMFRDSMDENKVMFPQELGLQDQEQENQRQSPDNPILPSHIDEES